MISTSCPKASCALAFARSKQASRAFASPAGSRCRDTRSTTGLQRATSQTFLLSSMAANRVRIPALVGSPAIIVILRTVAGAILSQSGPDRLHRILAATHSAGLSEEGGAPTFVRL